MPRKQILVLGGGAPNITLMSGALLALHDYGLTFDAISMSGAGAVVGLCYLAPKGLTPEEALRNTMNFGVSDAIYSLLPDQLQDFLQGRPFRRSLQGPLAEIAVRPVRRASVRHESGGEAGGRPALAGGRDDDAERPEILRSRDMRPRAVHRGYRGFRQVEAGRLAPLLFERLSNRHPGDCRVRGAGD